MSRSSVANAIPTKCLSRFFDHRNRRIVRSSRGESASIDLGFYFTNLHSRRIAGSAYDLLFTIDSRVVFPRMAGLPRKLPILYQTRDPKFSFFSYRLVDESTVKVLHKDEALDLSQSLNSPSAVLQGSEIPFNPKNAEDALTWAVYFR